MYDYRLFSPDQPIEMIDEFPFFSYLIGDLHRMYSPCRLCC